MIDVCADDKSKPNVDFIVQGTNLSEKLLVERFWLFGWILHSGEPFYIKHYNQIISTEKSHTTNLAVILPVLLRRTIQRCQVRFQV